MKFSPLALLLASLTITPIAAAQAPPEVPSAQDSDFDESARVHFHAGKDSYDRGDYESALREFQIAHEMSGRAALLYNLGACLERLDRFAEAADRLDAYVAATNPQGAAVIRERSRRLRARALAAEPRQGATLGPADARTTPTSPRREPAATSPPDTRIDPTIDPSPRPAAETSADKRFVVSGAIALGVGIAGLGVGLGAQLIGLDAINQWNASQVPAGLCRAEGDPGRPPADDPADCIDLYDRWSGAQPWVYVGYVAGGLLTVTGIVLLLIAPQVPVSGGTTLACGGGPGDIGVACSGTF